MQKTFILVCLLTLSISVSFSQSGVYKTYDDFRNGNLEKMDDEVNYNESSFGVVLIFKSSEGKTVKYKPKNMWGFLFKGQLFRSTDNDIAHVSDTGKICFYENGTAHLRMIRTGESSGLFIRGYYSYMSSDLNGKIYSMPFSAGGDFVIGNRKEYKKFMDLYPEYQKLYDCIDRSVSYKKIRLCVREYNTNKK